MPELLRTILTETLKQSSKSTLYLVRHGTTAFNEPDEDRLRAWLNIPLDENGIQKAHEAAEFLKNKDIVRIVSSDLKRCQQTAEIIAEKMQLPVHYDFGLRPWDVGKLTGTRIKSAIPVMMKYVESPKEIIPGGESYGEFYNRWKTTLEKYIARSVISGDTICLVTHSRNLHCLKNIVTGGDEPITFQGKPDPGGIIELEISNDSKMKEVL